MAENNNPIQVKKVSALPNFNEFYSVRKNEEDELIESGILAEKYKTQEKSPLENAFIMIAFPDNSTEYPHNYKLSLSDFSMLMVTSFNAEMNKVTNYISNLEQMIEGITTKINNVETQLSSIDESEIKNYWLYTKEEFDKFITNIADYCPEERVLKIKEHWERVNNIANEYWNVDETDILDNNDIITHFVK